MIKGIYVIYDELAKESADPFVAKNDEMAKLAFSNEILNARDKAKENKALFDVSRFDLKRIGTLDTESCEVNLNEQLSEDEFRSCPYCVLHGAEALPYQEDNDD